MLMCAITAMDCLGHEGGGSGVENWRCDVSAAGRVPGSMKSINP